MTGFHFEDSVSQRLLMRWRKLSHLAIGLSLLLLARLLVGLGLVDARQQVSTQLRLVLQDRVRDYTEHVALADLQLNLWWQKQHALAQWASAEQLSQIPLHTLLIGQYLAISVDGRIKKLSWDGQQIQIIIHSAAAWSVVQQGLQKIPWLSLESVRQINADEAGIGRYQYHVVIPYGA